jgi:hypothetical protein
MTETQLWGKPQCRMLLQEHMPYLLAACVAVHLCVKHQDVHVLSRRNHVVQATKACGNAHSSSTCKQQVSRRWSGRQNAQPLPLLPGLHADAATSTIDQHAHRTKKMLYVPCYVHNAAAHIHAACSKH